MRENMGLYRGKRQDNGEWIYGSFFYDDAVVTIFPNPMCIGCGFGGLWWIDDGFDPVDPETVGECSGERDKHGKLIFEGDIVQHMVNGKLLRGKVEYADGAFGVRIITGGAQFLCFFVDDTCEVIGNIHDNPELLGVSK